MIFSCDGNVFTGKTYLLNQMSNGGVIKIDEYEPHPTIGLASDKKEALEAQIYYINQEASRLESIPINSAYHLIGLDRSIFSIISHTVNLYLIWNMDIRQNIFSYIEELIKKNKIIIPNKFVVLDLPNDDIRYLWNADLYKSNTKGTLPFFVDYSYLNNSRAAYKRIEEFLPNGVMKIISHPATRVVFDFVNDNSPQVIQENVFLNALGAGLDL